MTLAAMKESVSKAVDAVSEKMNAVADVIWANPEVGFKEYNAAALLKAWAAELGFEVEEGYGGVETAFIAKKKLGAGGPLVGLMCEYDCVEGIGHACGHHMQPPVSFGAAIALMSLPEPPDCVLAIVGTPAEENLEGGKNVMYKNGAFRELDFVIGFHADTKTRTPMSSLALTEFDVTYHGVASHPVSAPDKGINALESVLLLFQSLTYLRQHVKVTVNYIGLETGISVNLIPDTASARIELRAPERTIIEAALPRVMNCVEAAALAVGTTYEVKRTCDMYDQAPSLLLSKSLMKNAELFGAEKLSEESDANGSTDFATVTRLVPGATIQLPFFDGNENAHTKKWLEEGNSKGAHEAICLGAKITAATVLDVLTGCIPLSALKQEFTDTQKRTGIAL